MNDMNKKVLIISASPRKGGNSDTLCDEFMRGALEAGHIAEKIRLPTKESMLVQDAEVVIIQ